MARAVPLVDRRLRWLAVVAIAGAILVASVLPAGGVGGSLGPLGLVTIDKWFHALGYAALALAIAYALAERDPRVTVIAAVVGTTVFGFGVELLQAAIPSRGFSTGDLLANAVGTVLVALGWMTLGSRVRFDD